MRTDSPRMRAHQTGRERVYSAHAGERTEAGRWNGVQESGVLMWSDTTHSVRTTAVLPGSSRPRARKRKSLVCLCPPFAREGRCYEGHARPMRSPRRAMNFRDRKSGDEIKAPASATLSRRRASLEARCAPFPGERSHTADTRDIAIKCVQRRDLRNKKHHRKTDR
jgi:hypothetical protein